jgi:hypothetical protein
MCSGMSQGYGQDTIGAPRTAGVGACGGGWGVVYGGVWGSAMA